MTAREGRSGAFAFLVGCYQKLVEEPIGITGDWQLVLMDGEIIADVREDAFRDVVKSCRMVIILRSCHGQQIEDQIIDEERGEDDERGALELLVAAEEIKEGYGSYQWEVAGVAHQQQLADEGVWHCLIEE